MSIKLQKKPLDWGLTKGMRGKPDTVQTFILMYVYFFIQANLSVRLFCLLLILNKRKEKHHTDTKCGIIFLS